MQGLWQFLYARFPSRPVIITKVGIGGQFHLSLLSIIFQDWFYRMHFLLLGVNFIDELPSLPQSSPTVSRAECRILLECRRRGRYAGAGARINAFAISCGILRRIFSTYVRRFRRVSLRDDIDTIGGSIWSRDRTRNDTQRGFTLRAEWYIASTHAANYHAWWSPKFAAIFSRHARRVTCRPLRLLRFIFLIILCHMARPWYATSLARVQILSVIVNGFRATSLFDIWSAFRGCHLPIFSRRWWSPRNGRPRSRSVYACCIYINNNRDRAIFCQ